MVIVFGVVFVGVGVFIMVGGKVFGVCGFVEGVICFCDLWENEIVCKWVVFVLGVVIIGLGVYFVFEFFSIILCIVGCCIKVLLV